MNMIPGGLSPVSRAVPSSRVEAFIAAHPFDRPTLVIDTDVVAQHYAALKAGLDRADIHYAVKANPAPEIVETLVNLGSHFDAASRGEIELCLSKGAPAHTISFGNTVKKAGDIAFAHHAGVDLFAADAEEEIVKIAEHAPGAQVYIRLLVEVSEADWPLSRKFGTDGDEALRLMTLARAMGLHPVGISFHVGSQTRRAAMWQVALDAMAAIWARAQAAGHALTLVNIGGGFPAFYGEALDAPETYARAVMAMVEPRFPGATRIMAEPGRGLVGEAGAIAAEVVLVAHKTAHDLHRWVYLDIGKFSGLAETIDEAIRYQFLTAKDAGPMGPCILAGPSCDSADVLYPNFQLN